MKKVIVLFLFMFLLTFTAVTYAEDKQLSHDAYHVTLNDLSLFNVDAYEDMDSVYWQIRYSYKDAIINNAYNDSGYYVTNSIQTDTTYLMVIEKNDDNRVIKVYYQEFEQNKSKAGLPFITSRGIKIGDKVEKIHKAYGTNPNITYFQPYPDGSRVVLLNYPFTVVDSNIQGNFNFYIELHKNQKLEDAKLFGFSYEVLN